MDTSVPGIRSEEHDALFANGGELGHLMSTFAWASTSIGPVEQWPQSLRSTLGILLHSRHPMFLWWGPDLIQFYNDGYRPSLGLDKHPQALGQAGRECWAEIWPVIGPLIENILAGGEPTWNEDQFIPITRNGYLEEIYWTYSYSPVFDENGKVGGVLVVCTETTGRVRAERRLRTLAGLTGNAIKAKTSAAVAAIAARVLTENSADFPFALLYTLTDDGGQFRLVASAGLAAGTPGSPMLLDRALLSTHASETWNIGYVLETGSASLVEDTALRFGPLPGGPWDTPSTSAFVLPITIPGQSQISGVLVAGISPGQAFDAAYQQFLESVVVALANALANVWAYQDLAELDRAKTDFFSNISHEFRTPLTLSLGPLEALLSDTQHPLGEEQRAQVEMVQRNAMRQLKLVNTLLDFARIEAGRVQASYQPTDLAQLTIDLASAFRAAIEKAELQLVVDCPPLSEPIFVDRDMWEKIVLNLLSNAFKFTFEGSIRVALHIVEGNAELLVQDTGVGISEVDTPRVFERFYQVHAAQARTQEGSGIGLALVQELVRLHGGTITVASTESRGTTFTVRLPVGKSHLPANRLATPQTLSPIALDTDPYVEEALRWLPEDLQPVSQERVHLANFSDPFFSFPSYQINDETTAPLTGTLLVADDNADMRDYLKRLLSPAYQVVLAANGTAALTLARNMLPDLIISDVMMPGLDGFALLEALRSETTTASIPVILLSARSGEEATLQGLHKGANDYLAKPFSAREMLARVRLWLEISRLRKTAELAWQHLHDLLMQAPAVICVLRGPTHIYEIANPLYYQQIGSRELIGKPIREALPELEGQGIYELLDQVYTSGEPFIGTEIRVELAREIARGPEEVYFNFVYQPIRADKGEVEGIMVHAVDVTEQVQARQRLQTFLGVASHELKNPLTSIKGNIEIALRRLNTALQQTPGRAETQQQILESVSQLLNRANRQVDFQNRLVSDLVDTTRIQAGKLDLRIAPADINLIVREAVEEQRYLVPTRTIQLEPATGEALFLPMDANRIGQVVTNYLSNALKYSEPEEEVFVHIEATATGARVLVCDHGPGLDVQEQTHIWERFYRAPGVQVKSGTGVGLGLGLYICRTIIEAHGGQVGVESVKDAGSNFWFTLPLHQAGQ
ncbi:MAG TPA: ATP-binding protein [Ktedonobacteraceae bacterium]